MENNTTEITIEEMVNWLQSREDACNDYNQMLEEFKKIFESYKTKEEANKPEKEPKPFLYIKERYGEKGEKLYIEGDIQIGDPYYVKHRDHSELCTIGNPRGTIERDEHGWFIRIYCSPACIRVLYHNPRLDQTQEFAVNYYPARHRMKERKKCDQKETSNDMSFQADLTRLINKHSLENGPGTPDFILAEYLRRCLDNFDIAVNDREQWYGRKTEKENINVKGD